MKPILCENCGKTADDHYRGNSGQRWCYDFNRDTGADAALLQFTPPPPVTPSEAVYGFAAWLTTRDDAVTFGSTSNCAPIVELVARYCEANGFEAVSERYPENLTYPVEVPA